MKNSCSMKNLEREEQKADKRPRFIYKEKRIQQIEFENTKLALKIIQGYVFDEKNLIELYYGPEYYRVMVWTDSESQYGTQVVKSFSGLSFFNQKLVIPLYSTSVQYLYIELLKGISWRDPGTSNGTNVMGRAKIKLPPQNNGAEFGFRVDLIGLNSDRCVVRKGFLDLSMKLHRYAIL